MAADDSLTQNSTLTSYDGVAAFTSSHASDGSSVVSSFGSPSVLTIGNFDGVHIGHQELIRQAVAKARDFGVPAVVFTFEPHPLMVLRPELKLRRLFDADDRREQLEKLGVDILVVEPFSRSFSQLTPEKFLIENVIRPFQPRAVVVGYDFSFGANRAGGIDFLTSHAESTGTAQTKIFDVEVVPPVKIEIGGQPTIVSSTRIRQAIGDGQPELARALLGRPYMVRGMVRKGAGRGRTIGIPTANIEPTVEVGVKPGVYAAIAKVRGQSLVAMVNIGTNPTFEGSQAVTMHIEAHLPKYDGVKDGDLYGETIELGFIERIRDEKKFSGVDELVAQIHRDIGHGMKILAKEGIAR
jgi:riboflavin kinase / FMN adenylyltransferase